MSKPDDKPQTNERQSTTPVLRYIRFREPLTLAGVTPTVSINLDDPKDARFEVAVAGASVFVKPPGDDVYEVPRAACVLRWRIAAPNVDEAIKAITGRK